MSAPQMMTFGHALALLKEGCHVARLGWNGKAMHLFLNKGTFAGPLLGFKPGEQPAADHQSTIDGVRLGLFEAAAAGAEVRLPNINMRSASGAIVTGWLASQTDMLAEDWCIVVDSAEKGAEGVRNDVGTVPAAGAAGMPSVVEPVAEIPAAEPVDRWKPTIGRIVTVKGPIANGTDEHPGMITRVFGAGEGALVNVTAFPDLSAPKILSSIPAYTSRTAARDAITGPSRANGYAFFPDRG